MDIIRNISNDQLSELVPLSNEELNTTSAEIQRNDPISRYINQILLEAMQKRSSDIHFEPYEHKYRIRLRCDGVLVEIDSPPPQLANRLSSRIKVMANLDIAEKRLPQDGRMKHTLTSKQSVDIRVSTLPTLWGEKIVLRLLKTQSVPLDITALGLSQTQMDLYVSAISKPQGLVLITGPTGSGKTISLYTALTYLNTPEKNISTAEDPIEINLLGINQVQMNDKIDLNFTSTLKALLRQDPDIIMIGEIRDIESAEIVIKAAQTGHLVLSTLHTNSASEAVTRLLNMGVDKFSLASCLSLIVAQRLTRALCPACKELDLETSSNRKLNPRGSLQIYKANPHGCADCLSGYSGLIGIFELLNIDKTLMRTIERQSSASEINDIALENGFIPLSDSGRNKLIEGITSIKELQRTLIF
ncbi:Flp pilus assembly complex ATPase component TadA [Vibrio sp. DW001]|uniref:GspE/PulE family protein n=1 Tax=Vibrio sp. DW001 TaxID=2912315 RepID=UPI0023B0ADD9|nr:ATPase, T2SS/T4P/T4SS family [Vibrio sp. DW001]WED26182.1 Flp pilus assembly complex ATPase component TadA [Vibrio sp. DW001]